MATIASGTGGRSIKDSDWVRQALFVPYRNNLKANAREYDGSFTIGSLMFEDTAMGGARFMNPKPQPCRFADPKCESLIAKVKDNLQLNNGSSSNVEGMETFGMGRWYAEKINQHQQFITIQAGIPQFNPLSNFLGGAYDPALANLANAGTLLDDLAYTLGSTIGTITVWAVAPMFCLSVFALSTGRKFLADTQNRPLSKFYYIKPQMSMYWGTVQNIVNAIVVNMSQQGGLGLGDLVRGEDGDTKVKDSLVHDTDLRALGRVLPDLFLDKGTGGVDIRAIANRYERLAIAHDNALQSILEKGDKAPLWEDVVAGLISFYSKTSPAFVPSIEFKSIKDRIDAYRRSSSGTGKDSIDQLVDTTAASGYTPEEKAKYVGDNSTTANPTINEQTASVQTSADQRFSSTVMKHWAGSKEFWEAEMRDGSQFVSFAIDYERHVSESFSSTTRESDLSAKMNSKSRASREALFSIANGNLGDNVFMNAIEGLVGIGLKAVEGVADSVGLSGLAMLGGRANIDIPEAWDSSSVSLPSMTYTIPLRSWSGHPVALLQNIYFPLAMILSLAAPRATGRASYVSPYYVKCWQKGYVQSNQAIVTNLQFTRGVGNLGWNDRGQPLAVDVHITITELSKIMGLPISADLSKKDMLSIALTKQPVSMFDEDTPFTDLMASWASLGLNDQYYPTNRWRIRSAKKNMDFNTFFTTNHAMSAIRDTTVGSFISLFHKQHKTLNDTY